MRMLPEEWKGEAERKRLKSAHLGHIGRIQRQPPNFQSDRKWRGTYSEGPLKLKSRTCTQVKQQIET